MSDLRGRKEDTTKCEEKQYPTNSRDYHNALERRRRKLISGKFDLLRNSIPSYIFGKRSEKVPRCMVLKSACNYISILEKANSQHRSEIEKLRCENQVLENEISKVENSNVYSDDCMDYGRDY